MPYEDDEMRRLARERLESRMQRRGSASSLASNAARRTEERKRVYDGSDLGGGRRRRAPHPIESGGRQPELYADPRQKHTISIGPLSFNLPSSIPPFAIAIAAALVVLILVFAVIVPSCTRAGGEDAQQAATTAPPSQDAADTPSAAASGDAATAQAGSQASSQTTAQSAPMFQKVLLAVQKAQESVESASLVEGEVRGGTQGALAMLLGEETAAKLIAQAKINVDALWIASHPAEFGIDGVEVQHKVLKLAADEPAAIDYVRNFPTSYPAQGAASDSSEGMATSSPVSNVPDTDIPHFYQWDKRWGYTTYSGAAFGMTGCGPTSLAMVYQGVTGSKDKSPYDMGKLANEHGYMTEYEGTDGAFLKDMAPELGMTCEELYPEADTLRQALSHGQTVIVNVAPGYFTDTGHYLVATGLTEDGQVIINDPYSVVRSSQTWDPDLLTSQAYVMYGYTKSTGAVTQQTESTALDAEDGSGAQGVEVVEEEAEWEE